MNSLPYLLEQLAERGSARGADPVLGAAARNVALGRRGETAPERTVCVHGLGGAAADKRAADVFDRRVGHGLLRSFHGSNPFLCECHDGDHDH